MGTFKVTDEQVVRFKEEGYLIVENLFDTEEIELLHSISTADQALANDARSGKDASGGVSKLAVRNDLQEDIYSACVRSHKVVDTMERLLGTEVYHFHHKMMMKEPRVGGAWEWHQDYGYWYQNNSCLFPDMASCMIAVDRATKMNGCLQVIKGSHKLGRIEHGKIAIQAGADPERVAQALERMELVHVELEPGTAVFFHSNLLHSSDQNKSEHARWALICCYNAHYNSPFDPASSEHPVYNGRMERWADEQIKVIGRKQLKEIQAAVG